MASRIVLRGATLVSAPFTLVGVVMSAVVVATALWMWSEEHAAAAGAWITLSISASCAMGCFVAARGCRVVVTDGVVRDQVAWCTVHSVRSVQIESIRVRRGAWRTYEMELADSSRRMVLGTGPVQFPAHLLPDARDRDLAAIDAMMGDLRT